MGGQKTLDESKNMMDEREEVKSVLVEFLQARGVNGSLAARAVKKATRLTTHLLSLLRMVYRIRYLTGFPIPPIVPWQPRFNIFCCSGWNSL